MRVALDTPAKTRALRWGLLLVSAAYLALVAAQFAADWLSSRPQLASLRAAVRLDPGNAGYHHDLGRYYDLVMRDPNSALEQYREAVRLNPHNARYWLGLADGYQGLGDNTAQADAIEHAVLADPTTPEVAWQAANLYLVEGLFDKAFHQFHVVLDGAPNMGPTVINLCWHVNPDADTLLREVMPANAGSYFSFLEMLMSRENTAAAIKVWDALIQFHQPIELRHVFDYVRYLILHKEAEEATMAWRQGASLLSLSSYLPSSNNLMVNGDFRLDVLNGGFDWQYRKQSSVSLTLDPLDSHAGHRSLAIVFDGPGVDEAGIFQFIAVQPATTYQFSGYYKTGEIDGAGGPHFALQDLYNSTTYYLSDELKYASGWRGVTGEFTTGPDSRIVVLRVLRIPAGGAIRGKLWIDDFRLIEKPASGDIS
jgi:hypothetical protein